MSTKISVNEVAKIIGGKVHGDGQIIIERLCPLNEPVKGALAFYSAKNFNTLYEISDISILAALIVHTSVPDDFIENSPIPLILCEDPQRGLIALVDTISPIKNIKSGISSKADISQSATIGENVYIGAFACIADDVIIEDDVRIFPQVVIYPDVVIGRGTIIHSGAVIREGSRIAANCVIQNGAVIGAEGFGYYPDENGNIQTVPQIGLVEISERVDIGANSCVDRAALGSTTIGTQTKLDNLVQVGHNVQIGSRSLICGQVGIGGSSKIGSNVTLAGQVGVADHLNIVDGVRVGGRGCVESDVKQKGDYSGYPLMSATNWLRFRSTCPSLPKLIKKFKDSKDGS